MVYLVGAGPGDPGLITVRGAECLALADVVVADRLAAPRLLEQVRPSSERIVRGPRRELGQEQINRILIDRARAGKIVVRLKGGDPLLFGRGGEEAEALVEAGVAYEIVPGVTAGLGVLAYAGIPLTHRGIASTAVFVTGHDLERSTNFDPKALADPATTVVLFMSVNFLEAGMKRLEEAGRSPVTPAAVITCGTRATQRTVVGTVADIAAHVRAKNILPPAIVVVGEVVKLREKLSWFERRPLHGASVLVSRARGQAEPTIARFEALGAEVFAAPAIEIVPPASYEELDGAILQFARYQLVALTSANAVDALFQRLEQHGLDARSLYGKVVAAIGERSEAALAARGVRADVVARGEGESTAEGLGKALAVRGFGGPALLPRAEEAREALGDLLRARKVEVDTPSAYRTAAVAPGELAWVGGLLRAGKIDAITFGSPRTAAALLAAIADRSLLESVVVGAVGPTTAAALTAAGVHVNVVPKAHTFDALADALIEPIRARVARRIASSPGRE